MAIELNSETMGKIRLALRISTSDFDDEIERLFYSGITDLGIAGVEVPEALDYIVSTALITYIRVHFGQPDNYGDLKASYDEQKAQLSTATGYTDWGDIDG